MSRQCAARSLFSILISVVEKFCLFRLTAPKGEEKLGAIMRKLATDDYLDLVLIGSVDVLSDGYAKMLVGNRRTVRASFCDAKHAPTGVGGTMWGRCCQGSLTSFRVL